MANEPKTLSDLGDLQGVGEPRDVVVALGVQEHLGLVLQAPERLRVDDPIPIPLEHRAEGIQLLRPRPPA